MIVGKAIKLKKEFAPTATYVKFVRDGLERNVETVYLIGHAENEAHIKQICKDLSDQYDLVSEKMISKVVIFGQEKRKLKTFHAALRAKNRQLYAVSTEL